jgi:hypothetical protein
MMMKNKTSSHVARGARTAVVASALFAGLLAGCGGGSDALPAELPFDRVRQATQYGFWPEQAYVFTTDAQWASAWASYISGSVIGTVERPAVDFSKRNLLGVSRGWGNNGCWALNITRVVETTQQIRVEYVQTKGPPPGVTLACTLAIVPMADFVTVPKSDKAVVYIELAR